MARETFWAEITRRLGDAPSRDITPPTTPIGKDDKKIGDLSGEGKKVYALMCAFRRRFEEVLTEHKHIHVDLRAGKKDTQAEHDACLQRLLLLADQTQALEQLFAATMRTEFFDAPIGDLALREGFAVVVTPHKPSGPRIIALAIPIPSEDDDQE